MLLKEGHVGGGIFTLGTPFSLSYLLYLEELTSFLTHGGFPDLPDEKGNHRHHTSCSLSLILSVTRNLTNYS